MFSFYKAVLGLKDIFPFTEKFICGTSMNKYLMYSYHVQCIHASVLKSISIKQMCNFCITGFSNLLRALHKNPPKQIIFTRGTIKCKSVQLQNTKIACNFFLVYFFKRFKINIIENMLSVLCILIFYHG